MNERGYSGPAKLSISLCCAECGHQLEMKGGKAQLGSDNDPLEIGPNRTFHIAPCTKCIEKVTAPAMALKAAIAAMTDQTQKPQSK